METFSALLPLCTGNSPVTGEFPSQRPVTRSFDIFLDLRLKKGWANNRDAGDLRRHRAHYDVTVMFCNEYCHISISKHELNCNNLFIVELISNAIKDYETKWLKTRIIIAICDRKLHSNTNCRYHFKQNSTLYTNRRDTPKRMAHVRQGSCSLLV